MKTKTLITMAVAGALIAGASAVNANESLELISGSSTVTGTVSAFGDTFSGVVGTWSYNVTTGTAALGGLPNIDISSLDAGSGNLEILFTAGWFTQNGGVLGTLSGHTIFGSATISDMQYLGYSPFDESQLLTSIGPVTLTTSGLDLHANGNTGLTDPYYLTEEVLLSARGSVEASIDASSAVPDGGTTMVLLGSALAALAGIRAKRA